MFALAVEDTGRGGIALDGPGVATADSEDAIAIRNPAALVGLGRLAVLVETCGGGGLGEGLEECLRVHLLAATLDGNVKSIRRSTLVLGETIRSAVAWKHSDSEPFECHAGNIDLDALVESSQHVVDTGKLFGQMNHVAHVVFLADETLHLLLAGLEQVDLEFAIVIDEKKLVQAGIQFV